MPAMTDYAREEILDELEVLLGEERWPEALALLERLPEDDPARWLQAVEVWLGMGLTARAEEMLARGRELAGESDALVGLYSARILLSRWDVQEAKAALERVRPARKDADVEAELALVADLEGRHEDANAHMKRAHSLDPDIYGKPLRLSPDQFERLVDAAAKELPPEFRQALEEVSVVIDPMPTEELVGGESPPDLLGLFTGLELAERESSGYGEMPPTIFLFQRNLERRARSRDELRDETRTTLFHELGHALGFDEEGVEGLGLR